MRLLQIVGLAAFCVLLMRVLFLATSGDIESIGVTTALAQEQDQAATTEQDSEENTEDRLNAEPVQQEERAQAPSDDDFPNIQGIEEIQNRSSRGPIAERLGERRAAVEKRERDIDLREQLLKAAEQRLKARLDKLKQLEEEKAEAQESKANEAAKDLTVIYENMKPKDAAKIFDALSLEILHTLATSMNPRKMSAIMAEMDVKKAERLTVEIALRSARQASGAAKQRKLPKIGG